MKKNYLALIIASAITMPAYAQSPENEGFYIGFNAGVFTDNDTCDALEDLYDSATCDDSVPIIRGHLGGRLNDNFAVEMGASVTEDLEFEVTDGGSTVTVDANYTALDIAAIGILPVSEDFELNARVGMAFYEVEGTAGAITIDSSGEDLLYGVGAVYKPLDEFSLNLEWMRIDGSDGDSDVIMAGVVFNF